MIIQIRIMFGEPPRSIQKNPYLKEAGERFFLRYVNLPLGHPSLGTVHLYHPWDWYR